MPATFLPLPSVERPRPFGLTRDSLSHALAGQGFPRYRADQIYAWLYQKHHRSPEGMRNLPSTLRNSMRELYDMELPSAAAILASRDQLTHKFVLELEDGQRVE